MFSLSRAICTEQKEGIINSYKQSQLSSDLLARNQAIAVQIRSSDDPVPITVARGAVLRGDDLRDPCHVVGSSPAEAFPEIHQYWP